MLVASSFSQSVSTRCALGTAQIKWMIVSFFFCDDESRQVKWEIAAVIPLPPTRKRTSENGLRLRVGP